MLWDNYIKVKENKMQNFKSRLLYPIISYMIYIKCANKNNAFEINITSKNPKKTSK